MVRRPELRFIGSMTTRVLILDVDEAFSRRLKAALAAQGTFVVSTVRTLREASDQLSRDRHDLVFLPVGPDASAVHALRAIQPDLRLILTKPTTQYRVPDAFSGHVQAVLIKPLLEIDLATVLRAAQAQPVWVDARRHDGTGRLPAHLPPAAEIDTPVIISILQRAKLGQLLLAAVFSRRDQLLVFWGDIDRAEAATVAMRAGHSWAQAPSTVEIQFVPLPPRFDELLLYTHIVADGYLLTLAALPETPLREVRLRARQLTESLAEALRGGPGAGGIGVQIDTGLLGRRKSYALVWRPVRPLPKSLHVPLRRALERLALANACVITFIQVQAELVHMIVLCPPENDSSWAAYLFKRGAESMIQQEFGVSATLWENGYYAAESTEPLSAAELKVFLAAN